MRVLEIIEKENISVTRITISNSRLCLKFNPRVNSQEREKIIERSNIIAEKLGDIKFTLRGRYKDSEPFYLCTQFKIKGKKQSTYKIKIEPNLEVVYL